MAALSGVIGRPGQVTKFAPLTDEIIGRSDEGRNIFRATDGSQSAERSTTFQYPENGPHYNYPTIFGGKQLTVDQARDIFIKNKGVDPETGLSAKGYQTKEAAIAAAQERSSTLGTPEQLFKKGPQREQGRPTPRPPSGPGGMIYAP